MFRGPQILLREALGVGDLVPQAAGSQVGPLRHDGQRASRVVVTGPRFGSPYKDPSIWGSIWGPYTVDSKNLELGPCRYRYRCRHKSIDTDIDWKKLESGPGTVYAD